MRSVAGDTQADETIDASGVIEIQQTTYDQLRVLTKENAELREQLGNQIIKTEEWYSKAEASNEELENLQLQLDEQAVTEEVRLQSQSRMPVNLDVIALLQNALLLKANAGGAIKKEIEKALALLTASTDS